MDRKEFLTQIGLGAAGVVLFGCLGGCEKKDGAPTPASNVNMTLDLTASSNAALLTAGGYVYVSNGIIVAKTISGSFIAVSQYCTHQGVAVIYQANANQFYCSPQNSGHGSRFSSTGAVTAGPTSSALKQYTVTQNGNVLTITG